MDVSKDFNEVHCEGSGKGVLILTPLDCLVQKLFKLLDFCENLYNEVAEGLLVGS